MNNRPYYYLPIFALFLALATLLSPSVSAQGNQWQVEYYGNRWHSGTPVFTRTEGNVADGFEHYWGTGSPDPSIIENQFAVRWTGTAVFPESATYEFKTSSDDGIRVWVDGRLVIDSYFAKTFRTQTNYAYVTAGNHQIRVDYYEETGEATAIFSWEKQFTPSYAPPSNPTSDVQPGLQGTWTGEYFDNTFFRGSPVFTRQDAKIDFNWGKDAPVDGLPDNGFSVRWTGDLYLSPGRYRFTMIVDDGARLTVGTRIVAADISDGLGRSLAGEYTSRGGIVPVMLEYREGVGDAFVSLSWVEVYPLPGAGDNTNPPSPSGETPPPNQEQGTPQTEPSTPQQEQGRPVATVNQTTSVHRQFDSRSPSIATLEQGETVQLAGTRTRDSAWVRVITPNGVWGWVQTSALESSVDISALTIWQDGWQ